MSELVDYSDFTIKLEQLEKVTDYKFSKMDLYQWYDLVLDLHQALEVDWEGSTPFAYQADIPVFTQKAGPCVAGIVFKQINGIYQPGVFHNLRTFSEPTVRQTLGLLPDETSIGVYSSNSDTLHRTEVRKLYNGLGLLCIPNNLGDFFNILVLPIEKKVIYTHKQKYGNQTN